MALAPFGATFKQSFADTKRSWKTLAVLGLIACAPSVALVLAVSFLPEDDATLLAAISLLGLASIILNVLTSMASMSLVYWGERSVGTLLRHGLKLIIPSFLIGLWTFVRTYAWIALIGGVIWAYGMGNASDQSTMLGGVILAVGLIIAIVRAPLYFVSFPVFAKEGLAPRAAVERSAQISRSSALRLFLYVLGFGVISWLIALAAAFVLQIPVEAAPADVVLLVAEVIKLVGNAVVTLILGAFSAFFLLNCYKSLTGRRG